METKKTLLIFLIVLVALSSLNAVSSLPARGPLLNDSLVTVYYSEPQLSTDYGYFYENGAYADDAYWAPWAFDVNMKFNVSSMYESVAEGNSSYKLDDFKEDLATMVNNGEIRVTNFMVSGVHAENINDTEISYSLDDNSSVLTVSFYYPADDEYGTQVQVKNRMNSLVNHTGGAYAIIKFGDLNDLDIKNKDLLANKSFNADPNVTAQLF